MTHVYAVFDPNIRGSTRGPSLSIDKVTYSSRIVPVPQPLISKARLRSMVMSNEAYNICDYSPYGLKNNTIMMNGSPVDITPGVYNVTTLVDTLEDLLVAIEPTITVTVDTLTFRMTIAAAVPFTLGFPDTSPYVELGFPLDYSVTADIHTGSNPINLSGPRSIYVNIPQFVTNDVVQYGTRTFTFIYPLTDAFPSESQLNWLNAGKTEALLQYGGIITQVTIELYFTRDGIVWPYIANSMTSYQLMIELIP